MRLFAIVDIEATGSVANQDKMTEIAVIITDGEKEVDRFETLLNPQQPITPFVVRLTGITNDMVKSSPLFENIASELYAFLRGKIFVAHNVNFDYKFLKQAFFECGITFNEKRLCTIRLSREIIPGMPSYSLSKLTRSLGIGLNNAHRAMPDTEATAELFELLYKKNLPFIETSLKANSNESTLPANLPKARFKKLPKKTGVYYFHNNKGEVIYIGKAKNLKSRVSSHFTGKLSRKNEVFSREIFDVSFELTGSELIAAFLEDTEIKHNWPVYNRSQKSRIDKFGVFIYEDRSNNKRLGINKVTSQSVFIKAFPTLSEARNWLIKKVDEFSLKPLCCGMEQFDREEISIEEHTINIEMFLAGFNLGEDTLVIKGKGRWADEKSFIYIEKGNYKGYGYYSGQENLSNVDEFKNFLTLQKETTLIRSVIKSELKKKKSDYEIITLS
jgi:DNA polymerase-3 subunit epsilon